MVQSNYLGDIAISSDIDVFVLVNFLKGKGVSIKSRGLDVIVDKDYYDEILRNKTELKTRQLIMRKDNRLMIEWLRHEITVIKSLPYGLQEAKQSEVLKTELKFREDVEKARDLLNTDAKADQIRRANRETFSVIDELGDYNIYEIYNHTGYVTSVIGISSAREIARQYDGCVVNEYGKKI